MVSVAIDHMISITVFLAALLLFINLFSQTNQTAIIYEEHRKIATKCSDLIDAMLLNPGSPNNWGQDVSSLYSFGLQDPDFTQYEISGFSLMRLASSTGEPVSYAKTSPDIYYNNITTGFGSSLLMPVSGTVNYSSSLKLLGINNSYGFQLALTPVINITISETNSANPLRLSLRASGTGFPLANASISYCLIKVSLPAAAGDYPSFTLINGTVQANEQGSALVNFNDVTDPNQNYGFIAYAHLAGLVGTGSYQRVSSPDQYVVPMINDLSQQKVLLAHNYDLNSYSSLSSTLKYNATFVVLTENFGLREMPLSSPDTTGTLTSGLSNPYINITIPTYTPGILIVPYQQIDNPAKGGIVLMPWGISSLGFPVTFGGDPQKQEWVSTDIRQITVNHVAYQAKLSVWVSNSLQGVN